MTADIVYGVDFQRRRASELSELEAASEAYLQTPDDLNFDRLLNCIKSLPRLHDVGGKPAFTFRGKTTILGPDKDSA